MKGKILIIEDNYMLSMIYSQFFEQAGYFVSTVKDGRNALSVLNAQRPDLILLDLHLPELSGASVLEYLRDEQIFADTKIILHSADDLMAERFLDKVDGYVRKPSSIHDLLGSVDSLLMPVVC